MTGEAGSPDPNKRDGLGAGDILAFAAGIGLLIVDETIEWWQRPTAFTRTEPLTDLQRMGLPDLSAAPVSEQAAQWAASGLPTPAAHAASVAVEQARF